MSENNLTLQRAIDIVTAAEMAVLQPSDQPPRQTDAEVLAVHEVCKCCGKQGGVCHFRSRVCFQCGMKGHLRSMSLGEPARPNKRPQAVKQVAEQQPDQDNNDDFTLWTITGDQKAGYHVNVLINGKHVQMELDTGAAVSVLSEQEWNELFPKTQIDHNGGGPLRGLKYSMGDRH